jgi:CDP-diacylglycerol--serine O-phosphatidyltransferase
LLPYSSFLIPIFSAIRLAKFNNDSRQSNSFIGLPTPANAILICSIPLVIRSDFAIPTIQSLIFNSYFLSILSCILSFLLVAELPLIALKFKNFNWKENKIRFIFLGLSAVLLAVFQVVGIPLVIILYILISSLNNLFLKKKN